MPSTDERGNRVPASVNPTEAEWVRRMYEWSAREGLSCVAIAVRLNDAGVIQHSGKRWQSSTVQTLLTSPRNLGVRTHKGVELGRAEWDAIVDRETFDAAVSAIDLRKRGVPQGRRSTFTGIVQCARCGNRGMGRTMVRGVAIYRCTKKPDLGIGCGQTVKAAPVERRITEAVLRKLGEQSTEATPPEADTSGELTAIGRIEAKLAKIGAMNASGEMDDDEWTAMRGPLVARKRALTAAITRTDASAALARLNALAGDRATLVDRWPSLDADIQRRLILTVFERVLIAHGKRGCVFDMERMTPVWK